MRLKICGGQLIDPAHGVDGAHDVLIEAGKVAAIAPPGGLDAVEAPRLEAGGLWVLPGLIDVHVHLREPGEEYKEDIASGSAAAAAGGFTTVVAMPNTRPVIDSAELVAAVQARGAAAGLCRVLASGAVTAGQRGERLAPFAEMAAAGAVAFTDDGHPVADAGLMRQALAYACDFDLPVLTHAEAPDLSRGCHMHEGQVSTRLGIRGAPRVAEDAAVARDIMLAEYVGGRLHVCHVSTAGAVALIRAARGRGVRVSGEAAPHHFSLTDAAVEGYRTAAKMNPPLREEADRAAVVAGLADGTLEAIATDHAPHSTIEKDTPFAEAAHGVIGLQTALPLTLALVRDGALTRRQAVRALTAGPAALFGLPYGGLAVGQVADVALVDAAATWTLRPADLRSKSHNTPFLGQTLTGRVMSTILAGREVFRLST